MGEEHRIGNGTRETLIVVHRDERAERMSTIPDDFVNFLVPVIQEFDGAVEQVR